MRFDLPIVNGIIGTEPMWKPVLSDQRREPVFRQIVQAIADDVASSRLAVGARLPPHRDLADELLVARGTVARAYREAEKLGLIRSEVGRGTHVLAPDGGVRPYSSLLEPPTVVGDLSTNVPLSGIDPDPADLFRRLAERPDRKALLRYHPPFGTRRHRQAGVNWLSKMHVVRDAEQVVLCAGAQHALFVVLSHLASRACAIYVEELTYPGIHGIAEALRLPLVPLAMDGQGANVGSLERACQRHGPGVFYCMPTIHNPLGSVMSDERRKTVAELARRYGVFVVEDAANRMLAERPPPPISNYAPERTFLVATVSKVLAPGLRVAFLTGPEAELSALSRLVWATEWMVGPIGAEMVAMWLEDGSVDEAVARKRREAARRQALVRSIFGPSNVTAHPSALHAWVSLPAPWRPERFAHEAEKRGLVVTPSSAFWTRTTSPPRAIRIALGGIDDLADLRRALKRLAKIGRE